ncbi:MAG: hypothetical protein V2I97_23205 [Desulfococcaceae bacterium]|jgi:hypothetical protein|nr:hypothetical protein [Desulfococcaceae bacterium]
MRRNEKKSVNREMRKGKSLVEGIIAAAEWDDEGNVTEIRILTTEEDEYIIENGEMFMDLIRKHVQASGSTHVNKNGSKSIEIKKCSLVDNAL